MDVSTSEHESDFSTMDSMSPQSRESPNSSPSQHLAQVFRSISCSNGTFAHQENVPFLRILEQPMNYFRFRYKSEMVGTHGCLLGRSTGPNRSKTHPTVELVNHEGRALIRVRLAQVDADEEHPHKLLEDEQEDRDVIAHVPLQGSYKVAFAGISIIHTAKKNVSALLFAKCMKQLNNPDINEIRAHCENAAKAINLNKVRLKFSAHDAFTDKEICQPVFSEPIHNMKSAATNDLRICRMSRSNGRARGGDDVYLLVEKVNKKNILVRFFEVDESGEEVWSATGNFLQSDVHHQYAIVVRTPPYRDTQISSDVRVQIELRRPSDGRFSEPKEFVYKADQVFRQNKKRRANSSFSSLGSVSGGSINSLSEIPTTVTNMTQNNEAASNIPMYHIEIPLVPPIQVQPQNDLAEALVQAAGGAAAAEPVLSPMLGQPNLPEPPAMQFGSFNSSEFQRLLDNDTQMSSEEKKKMYQVDLSEYMQFFSDSINEKNSSMEFFRSLQLVADSGRGQAVKTEPVSESALKRPTNKRHNETIEKTKSDEYTPQYKPEEGQEVKRLVKEICKIIKNKGGFKKQTVCSKLERLMEIRLSNGDTFLHMTLSSNQPSFEYIVRLIHSMHLDHLLNLTNQLQQTILHLAVVNDMPSTVSMLVDKGCDVCLGDREGNTPLHYAVICRGCLAPLLAAAEARRPQADLNAYNNEKQTALHLAAIYDAADSARLLLAHGASYSIRDSEGRTPLHLATYDDYLDVTKALLEFIPPSEIDAVDGRGNTALQIVCGSGMRENTLDIVKLLLEKKADPLRHEPQNASAWQLSQRHEAMRYALSAHVPASHVDVKSEPEDDYESADDGEYADVRRTLRELPLYIGEVSALLDACGAWRHLAAALQADQLASLFARTDSPARTLLTHLKECNEGLTSKSLAMCLQDIGQVQAANIVRKFIK